MTLDKWLDAYKNGYGVASPGEHALIQLLNEACARLSKLDAVEEAAKSKLEAVAKAAKILQQVWNADCVIYDDWDALKVALAALDET